MGMGIDDTWTYKYTKKNINEHTFLNRTHILLLYTYILNTSKQTKTTCLRILITTSSALLNIQPTTPSPLQVTAFPVVFIPYVLEAHITKGTLKASHL